jgi:hypothetical protein
MLSVTFRRLVYDHAEIVMVLGALSNDVLSHQPDSYRRIRLSRKANLEQVSSRLAGGFESRSAQAPPEVGSRADARTYRHRSLTMPSMPKGNSGLPCQPARSCTMGFFVMIDQRPNWHVFPTLCTRANASVRRVSSLHLFSAHSRYRCASELQSVGNSNHARMSHDQQQCDVCSGRYPPYNPHRQSSLLHPTL